MGESLKGDIESVRQVSMRARVRRGYSNGLLVLIIQTVSEIIGWMQEYELAQSTGDWQWLGIGRIIPHASLYLFILGYTIYHGVRLKRLNTRELISQCSDEELAQARVEIAEAGLVQAVLTGEFNGREHFRRFPLSTFFRIGGTKDPWLKMRHTIESVSYNCRWYIKRKGMCREHADMLPWLFYFIGPILVLALAGWIVPFFGKWAPIPLYGLCLAGLAASIYARLRINAGAGIYELAFYDELAVAASIQQAEEEVRGGEIQNNPEHLAAP